MVVGTHPLCALRPDRSIPGAVASAPVSDPSGTDVSTSASDVPPTTASGSVATRPDTSALAARFETLADDDFAGYCPIYERIARAIADDGASLALLLDAAPVGRTPVLFLAAVHDLVLGDPDGTLAHIYAGRSDADPWPPVPRAAPPSHRRDPRPHAHPQHPDQRGRSQRGAAAGPRRACSDGRGRPATSGRSPSSSSDPAPGSTSSLDRYGVTYRRDGLVRARRRRPHLARAARLRAARAHGPAASAAFRSTSRRGPVSTSAPSTSPTTRPAGGSPPACGPVCPTAPSGSPPPSTWPASTRRRWWPAMPSPTSPPSWPTCPTTSFRWSSRPGPSPTSAATAGPRCWPPSTTSGRRATSH